MEHTKCRVCGHDNSEDLDFIDVREEIKFIPGADFIGKECLIRSNDFGIFFGKIIERTGKMLTIRDSRQIVSTDWSKICLGKPTKFFLFHGLKTVSLLEVAKHGIDKKYAILCPPVPFREVHVSQILVASDECRQTILCIEPKGRKKLLAEMKSKRLGTPLDSGEKFYEFSRGR
jgi:hypothetical protein